MNRSRRITPGPGQESVWDYPRPPKVEESSDHIQVRFNDVLIVDTHRAKRVLETSHPPVYYLPPEDIKMEYFIPTSHNSYCEFKGTASYYTIKVGEKTVSNGAWYYRKPSRGYEDLTNYIALYPSKMDACYVNDEQVQAQESDFYGGWITSRVVGPFKGGPGTYGW